MIIVAEPDKVFREQLVHLVKKCSEVEAVDSGEKLLSSLHLYAVDVIIVGANLGRSVENTQVWLAKIRETFSKMRLPILWACPAEDKALILRGYQSGANDIVRLPLDADVVGAQLRHFLEIKSDFNAVTDGLLEPGVAAPAHVEGSPTYTGDALTLSEDTDKPIPCEIPLSLTANGMAFFCKTIWMTRRGLLLMSFDEVPGADQFEIQMRHPEGGMVDLVLTEIKREALDAGGAGSFKLNLKIIKASKNFDGMFSLLRSVYRKDGLSGLHALLPDMTGDAEKKGLGGTMIFSSSSDNSLNLIEGTRYRFEKNLGRGSFASVYLVRDMSLKRSVAMKVLNPDFSKVSEARRNFLFEAQIAAQFHHPNVVFVFEVGEISEKHYANHLSFPKEVLREHPDRMIYFTMQYVEGATLSQWMYKNPKRTEAEMLDILVKILRALVFAHSKGVIHRDIKPENIMITEDSQVLVADFGIASLTQAEDRELMSDSKPKMEIACTPKYAAPEQFLGDAMDHRSDIYSFGILAYELLTGTSPFDGYSFAEIAHKHMGVKPEPLRAVAPQVDPKVEALVLKCIEKKKSARFQATEDLLRAFETRVGSRSSTSDASIRETLAGLIEQAIVIQDNSGAAMILQRLTAFLHLHKTHDNVDLIKDLKIKLSDPSLINVLVEKNLNDRNFQLLYQYFSELESSRAVSILLNRFVGESNDRIKQFLGELSVLSAGHDLMPLVSFGLELADHDACILLKSFAEAAPKSTEGIFKKWANHSGFRTQRELLKIVSSQDLSRQEILFILERFAMERGSVHPQIRRRAEQLLSKRMAL